MIGSLSVGFCPCAQIPRIQDGREGLHPHTPGCPSGSGRAGGAGCLAFPAPCPFDTGMLDCPKGEGCDGNGMGACSSDWVVGLITDEVIIPKDLEPGAWVLSWRWCDSRPSPSACLAIRDFVRELNVADALRDCEETAQIWQNCADVEIVKSE